MAAEFISQCQCGSRRVSVAYTEKSRAYFNEDGGGREDGHDVWESVLDTEDVRCRGCGKERGLTERDLALILEEV